MVCLVVGFVIFALGMTAGPQAHAVGEPLLTAPGWMALIGGLAIVAGLLGLTLHRHVTGEHG